LKPAAIGASLVKQNSLAESATNGRNPFDDESEKNFCRWKRFAVARYLQKFFSRKDP